MSSIAAFDRLVGRIAGAIYTDITRQFPQPPLLLVPALTFKVRKILEQITDLELLTEVQKAELAKEIQISVIPMLFSYEVDPDVIEQVTPTIEWAAFKALTKKEWES